MPLNNQILKLNIDPSGMKCELKGTVVREWVEMEWGGKTASKWVAFHLAFQNLRNLFVTALKAYFYILYIIPIF